jgi:phosphoserine phosphatase
MTDPISTPHVLTLISGTAEPVLTDATVDIVAAALVKLGARLGPADWLAADQAVDLPFDDLHPDQADAAAAEALRGLESPPIDIIAQPSAGRRKRLLVADMESTIIENEMLDELADLVGLRAEVADITARAMNGELDFEAALKARVSLLRGLPVSALDKAGQRIRLMPGARILLATLKRHGVRCALVSGGFLFYTGRIAAELGFDVHFGNDLLIEDGMLTGKVREPVLTRQSKLDTLIRLAAEQNLPFSATVSVGDGANDLPMLDAAGLGIAFHAKPAVLARAKHRVVHADLTALLFAQGYRLDEFATA